MAYNYLDLRPVFEWFAHDASRVATKASELT
jgi:hypothetical protein